MTARYVAMWISDTHEGWQERPSSQVVESDTTPVSIGLLDASETPLYRIRDRVPFGFQARRNVNG